MENTFIKPQLPQIEDVIELSTLDQQAQRHYAKFLLFFNLGHNGPHDPVIRHLKQGLSAALSELPDFASSISPDPASCRKELQLLLGPASGVPWRDVDHTAQDGRWLFGSYQDLAGDKFAMNGISLELLVHPAASIVSADTVSLAAFLVQANLIRGGLILSVSWHHTVADAHGLNLLMRSWANHTKNSIIKGRPDNPPGPTSTAQERWRLQIGQCGPHNDTIVKILSNYVTKATVRAPATHLHTHLVDRQENITTRFQISTWYLARKSLQSLREDIGNATEGSGGIFTAVECVSALTWRCISRARHLHVTDEHGTSLFTTRIDFRQHLNPPLSDGFVGNACEPNAGVRLPVSSICSSGPPSDLALAIRAATQGIESTAVHGFIGYINTLPAVTDLTWNYSLFPGPDLGLTDISGMDVLRTDWGIGLGFPDAARLAARENGLVYLLPIDSEGGFEVQIQCEPEAFDRLREDNEFTRYATLKCVAESGVGAGLHQSPV
ncbi:transferase family-domain-containing protein [Cladorrhinum sp. PSN259]|nr:transferase family-domain-containing protein [Cladorrhinum sp. PSN259]